MGSEILFGPERTRFGQCQLDVFLFSSDSEAALRCGRPPMMPPSRNRIPGFEARIEAIYLAVRGDVELRSR